MGILSGQKAEPTDPVRGFLNDVIDIVGFPRPEEALGTPADVVHQAGLPTVRDFLPMPADVGSRVLSVMRRGMPALPKVPSPPGIDTLFPTPGESVREADVGESTAATTMRQPRYYQRPL